MILTIAPADLPAFFGAEPQLLVLPGVEGVAALGLPGLGLWLVETGAAPRLYRPGAKPSGEAIPLTGLPARLLGIVAPEGGAAGLPEALARLGGSPPVFPAASGATALPAVAAALLALLRTEAKASATTQRALVAARQEAEETRIALVSVLRQVGQTTPPAALEPALDLAPSHGGDVAAAAEGRLALGQILPLPLHRLAAIGLHLQDATVGPAGALRIRLYGAESGRLHGAWLVTGDALVPGWLSLELPGPLPPLRETALLDIQAELEAGDSLALSLEDRTTAPDRAAAIRGAPPQDRALALRAWTAPFGCRFAVPAHWDPEAADLALAPEGVPVELPAQIWDHARYPLGQVERVALGHEPGRLIASFGAGRRLAIVLPGVPVNGIDLLQATLDVGRGDAAMLEAALWLQPDGAPVALETDLSTLAPEARWSGWRRARPGQPLRLPLALPLRGPASVTLVLVLRHTGPEGRTPPVPPLRVEWSGLAGFRLPQAPPMPAGRDIPAPPPAEPIDLDSRSAAAPPAAAAEATHVRLEEFYATPDGGYRHIDIWLEGVQAEAESWPRLRVKLALRGEGPCLEFRTRPGWPRQFEQWPGTQLDEWGPVLLLNRQDMLDGAAARLRTPRDRRMLAALLQLLPNAVARVVREMPGEAGDPAEWHAAAERLSTAPGATAAQLQTP
jgi:hypothetical protein